MTVPIAAPARRSVLAACLPTALVAAGYALTLAVFYPGIMNYDAHYVYQDSLKGFYGDWQSPVMTWLWSVIDPPAPGSASMFLLMISLYWLAVLILSTAIARRSLAASIALPLLAISPPLFALLGVIWRDILMAGIWLLAAAMVYASRHAARTLRLILQASALCLVTFGVLLRPNALAAAPLLIAFILWPSGFRLKKTALAFIPVMIGLYAIVQFSYYGVLDAKRQNPLHSIVVFDLGGISHFSKQNQFPVEWTPTEQDAVLNRCYDPLMWNVYWNGDCKFVMGKIEGEQAIFGTPALSRAWIEALLRHPLAYAQHRLSFFRTFLAGQNLGMWVMDIERPPHSIFEDRPAFTVLRHIHDALQPTPLFRIGTWLLLNLAVCFLVWRKRHTPEGALAIGLCGSAAIYILSFLPLGVAAEFRYGYWAVLAGIMGGIVAALPVSSSTNARPARAG